MLRPGNALPSLTLHVAAVVAALFVAVGIAHAQWVEDEETEDLEFATLDSLAAGATPNLLDHWHIHPRYGTTIDLNRGTSLWRQTLDAKNRMGPVRADNSLKVEIVKNPNSNDFKKRTGNAKTVLSYDLRGLGGWSTGGDFNWARAYDTDKFGRRVNNSGQFGGFVQSFLPQRVLNSLLGQTDSTSAFTVDLTGRLQSTTSGQRNLRRTTFLVGGVETVNVRYDSTDASGLERSLDMALRGSGGTVWSLALTGGVARGEEDSNTRILDTAQQLDTLFSQPTSRRSENTGLSWSYRPSPKLNAKMDSRYQHEFGEAFSTKVQKVDRKDGIQQKLSGEVSVDTPLGLNVTVRGDHAFTRTTQVFDLFNGRSQRSNAGTGIIDFTLGSLFGPLRSVSSTTTYDLAEKRNGVQDPKSPDYDVRQRRLQQILRRPIGAKVALALTAEGNLDQTLYDDESGDRDDARFLVDATVGYRPGRDIDAKLSGSWTQRHSVNLATTSSASNALETTYTIFTDYSYPVSETVKVRQRYSVAAVFSNNDFDEENDLLTRTSEARTWIDAAIGAALKLQLEHSYQFRNSGRYTRSSPRAPLTFTPAQESMNQYLVVTTKYLFTPTFDIHASQRAEVRSTTVVATKKETRAFKVDFTGGAALTQQLDPAFNISAAADRVESTVEKSYWKVNASVNRIF